MPSTRFRTAAQVGLVAAMLAAPLAVTQVPSVRSAVFSLAASMRGGSPTALAIYLAACVVASLLTVPLWILAGIAGFAYGFPQGLAAALPGITAGGVCAFLVGRLLRHTALGAALRDHRRFRNVDAVVRHDGRRIATLLRVTPMMPQNLLHYALGATALPLRDFAFATFVGLSPIVGFQVYAASLAHDASEFFQQGGSVLRSPENVLKAVAGLVVTGALLVTVMRLARRALAKAVAETERRAPEAEVTAP